MRLGRALGVLVAFWAPACGARSSLHDSAPTLGSAGVPGSGGRGDSGTGGTSGAPQGACAPGEGVVDLWTPSEEVWGLALDTDHVYWTTPVDGTVWRIPKIGGTATPLGVVPNADALAVGADQLFVASLDSIYALDKLGGTAKVLATADIGVPMGVAVDGDWVYFTARETTWDGNGMIGRVPVGGGPAQTLATGLRPSDLVLDETHVYAIVDWSAGIRRMPKDGGPVELVDYTFSTDGIAVDALNVYRTEGCAPGCGRVLSRPKSGGDWTVLAEALDGADNIAQDAASVYWMTFSVGGGLTATIDAVKKDGGPTSILAGGLSGGVGGTPLAVDGACVYFAQYHGALSRIPKG